MLRPYNAQSGGLGFLNEEGRLVGAGTPTGGDGNTEEAQVHAELAAMLIPVTEHDVTQELAARLSEDLAAADGQSPGFVHAGVVRVRKALTNGGDALRKGLEDFVAASGLWEVEAGFRSGVGVY